MTKQANLFIRGAQDYAALPEWLLFDNTIPAGAIRLWSVLYFMAFHNRNNLMVRHSTIVGWTGASVSTVQRHLKILEEKGALTIENNYDGNLQKENTYYIEYIRRSVTDDRAVDQETVAVIPAPVARSPLTDNSIVVNKEETPSLRCTPEDAGRAYAAHSSGEDWYFVKLDGTKIWHGRGDDPAQYFELDGTRPPID